MTSLLGFIEQLVAASKNEEDSIFMGPRGLWWTSVHLPDGGARNQCAYTSILGLARKVLDERIARYRLGTASGLGSLEPRLFEFGKPVRCVYFLMLNGQVQYIGQTGNLPGRLASHRSDGKEFDRALYFVPPQGRVNATEDALIRYLRPPLNLPPKGGTFEPAVTRVLIELGIFPPEASLIPKRRPSIGDATASREESAA